MIDAAMSTSSIEQAMLALGENARRASRAMMRANGAAKNQALLAMADATAAELIPGLVQIVEKEAPAVSLRVLPLTTRDPRRMLENEEVDMAIGYFPAVIASLAARGQSGVGVAFETQRLYLGQYVCVMRRGHPLASAPLSETGCVAPQAPAGGVAEGARWPVDPSTTSERWSGSPSRSS